MLDRNFIVNNIDLIRENNKARNMRVDLDRFIELDSKVRSLKISQENVNHAANRHAESIKSKADKPTQEEVSRGRELKEKRATLDKELLLKESELIKLQQSIPNLSYEHAPIGNSDADNSLIEYGKTKIPEFEFEVRDHLQIGKLHDLFDFESASRVAGPGFYYLKGDAVKLDIAIQLYALDILERNGFKILSTPDVARLSLVAGTGYNPRGEETQIYSIENSDLGLVATSEIALAGMYADQIIDENSLPLLLGGLSHCFRTEAGGAGRAGRGLYRVHQFSKVEMFIFARPEESESLHHKMLEIEKEIFDGLDIPYRVVENATGDMGASAFRKFDIEAWMPGRDSFGEITSASNCTDYQARRLKIRMRSAQSGKSLGFVHTLNGTAAATGRAMVAILENCQFADGSVSIPPPLQAVVGKKMLNRS